MIWFFVGRLVSEKGMVDLLSRPCHLRTHAVCSPSLTIVGAGPEFTALQELAARSEPRTTKSPLAVRNATRRCANSFGSTKILVVPSRYDEPFGVVALEGIACGCVVVGSAGGGLPEAIGPCGLTFPNGDATALAESTRIAPRRT